MSWRSLRTVPSAIAAIALMVSGPPTEAGGPSGTVPPVVWASTGSGRPTSATQPEEIPLGFPNWGVEGDKPLAELGQSVSSAGDVNGDGFDDVIVGAHGYSHGYPYEGSALAYLGSGSGLSRTPAWVATGGKKYAGLGDSVAGAGDVNGDGYDDVIVSTVLGQVFGFLGSASGLSPTADWVVTGEQPEDGFGGAIGTAGDVNGDGYDDVVIGAPSHDGEASWDGRAYLYLGSPTGSQMTPAWTADGGKAGASFGFSVLTAGDVNGDGYDDVVIGAITYSDDQDNEGRAYVFDGSAAGLSEAPSWIAEGNQETALFGISVGTAGDTNADGYDDVIVGATNIDGEVEGQGRAFVYRGSAGGLSSIPAWTVDGDDEVNAEFGFSVATAGDVNRDGFDDVVVGEPYYGNVVGSAFLFLGPTPRAGDDALVLQPKHGGGFMGCSVATAGDVNGDGRADVLVGAKWWDDGQDDEGVVFAYYG
jgi:FG-GAP-like repeat/FG-GAP repeat